MVTTEPKRRHPWGEIASRVLFENDRVKIWNLIVEPGQTSPWHIHTRNYVTVAVEGPDYTSVERGDGTTRVFPSTPGFWYFHTDINRVHRVVNDTDTPYVNVLVELKD